MQWHYSSNGAQHGPVSTEELKSQIAAGAVQPTDLAWREGMADWTAVASITELNAQSASTAASPYQSPTTQAAAAQAPPEGGDFPNYLWQSIVVTLLCCLPFGVVAIIYASKVDALKRSGDWLAARTASNKAKMWVNISAGSVLVLVVISIILNLLGVAIVE